MKKVILAGNASTADVLNYYLAKDQRYKVIGATTDDEYVDDGGVQGMATFALSALKESVNKNDCVVIMAMGYNDLNRSRESMYKRMKEMGFHIETYVHPDAGIYTEHPLGDGSVVLPAAVIEPHVRIGANTMVWCNVTVAHHSSVAEHCWIASGTVISGQAKIERNCFVGVNATVVNKVSVREYNIIGGGTLITKDTKPYSVHLARSGEETRFSSRDYDKYFGV